MFGKHKGHKDGLQSSCKKCEKERTQSYYRDHPEKKRLKDEKWNLENADKIKERVRRWQKENPDKVKERGRRWQKENPDKAHSKNKRYLAKLSLANAQISTRTLHAWAVQVKVLNPRCDWCLTVDDLEAHHIKPKAQYPELALDISNGQTLCTKHHDEIHSTKL